MIIELEVRDYECDVQGIVNNAVYLQYLEHARHKFLMAKEIDFVALAKEGKNLVIRKASYEYHKPLMPDDKFTIETESDFEGNTKILFTQKIYRTQNTEKELILSAQITGACVDFETGKIFRIADILDLEHPEKKN